MADAKELLKAQELAKAGVVSAPANFLNATLDQLLDHCNGCGASGSWFRPPERIYGTLIVFACHIHDWQYSFGYTNEDKEEADRTFKHNMLRLITRDSAKWYKPTRLQRIRAHLYYVAVCRYGGEAFWAGKV